MKKFEVVSNRGWAVDVLWGQPIKLIQVASDSELRENQWNNLLFFEIVPSHCTVVESSTNTAPLIPSGPRD